MPDQEVKIRISTDASGAISGFSKVTDSIKKTESESASLASKIKTHWLGLSAAVAGFAFSASQSWGMIKAGAEYDEQKGILDNLARKYSTTADSLVGSMAEAADGMVANSDLMRVALGGISKGLKPDQLINLADAAKILADTVGVKTTVALNDLAEALETGKAKALKHYVGTLDLATAFGDLESKLTAAERAQAMYALVMIETTKKQNEQTKAVDESADKIDRLEASYKNMTTTMSRWAKIGVVSVWEGISGYIDLWRMMVGKTGAKGPGVYEVPPIAPAPKSEEPYKNILNDLKKNAASRVEKKPLAAMKDDSEKLLDELWKKRLDIVKEVSKAEEDMADEVEKGTRRSLDSIEKMASERLTAERDMYSDLRGYEDAYYAASIALVESQVKRYRELGIEEVAIAAWVAEEKRKAMLQMKRSGTGGTFSEGWGEGVKDWGKDVNNMFVQGEKMAKTAATSMSSSFSDLFFDVAKGEFKGFESYFKSFTDSILRSFSDMLADMVAKWILEMAKMQMISAGKSAMGFLSGLFGSGGGDVQAGGYGYQANGNAFRSGNVIPFAAGGIVSRPTIFPMARGMGMMGEAGPEAIMPLKRAANGALGVMAAGGGLNLTVNVSADVGSKKMIAELRSGIESTVASIIRKHS